MRTHLLMLQITSKTSHQEISESIGRLREQKGKEKEVLEILSKARVYGFDFVVNNFWELALTYQHLVMNEDAKGDNADSKERISNLFKMEEAVKHAGYFIVRFDQEKWKHRLYRFLGRVSDYKGDYKRAINYYRRSLKCAKEDPEYLENKYPRWLEVMGFLSSSLIMSGEIGKGHTMARDIYEKFDTEKDALFLKQTDYSVWAIWKSGIPIRTINALIDKKVIFDKKEMLAWIADAQKILKPEHNFDYRLAEIKELKVKLRQN